MLRVLENTVNSIDLRNDAMNKGIKNYTRNSKSELIIRLWFKTETIDKVNLKRIKTCNNNSKARREATNNNIGLNYNFHKTQISLHNLNLLYFLRAFVV